MPLPRRIFGNWLGTAAIMSVLLSLLKSAVVIVSTEPSWYVMGAAKVPSPLFMNSSSPAVDLVRISGLLSPLTSKARKMFLTMPPRSADSLK